MSIDEMESEALKLDAGARARLAERLLRSLDELSPAEIDRLWAEEAARRDAEMDRDPAADRPGEDVLRDARAATVNLYDPARDQRSENPASLTQTLLASNAIGRSVLSATR